MAAVVLPAQALPLKAVRATGPVMTAGSVGGVGNLSFRSGVTGTAAGLAAAAAVAPAVRPAHGVELALATPTEPTAAPLAPVASTAGNGPVADAESPPAASRFLIACLAIGGFLAVRSRVRRG